MKLLVKSNRVNEPDEQRPKLNFSFLKTTFYVRFSLPDYLVVALNAFDQLLLVLSLYGQILSVRPVLFDDGRVISQRSLLSGPHNGRYVLMQ